MKRAISHSYSMGSGSEMTSEPLTMSELWERLTFFFLDSSFHRLHTSTGLATLPFRSGAGGTRDGASTAASNHSRSAYAKSVLSILRPPGARGWVGCFRFRRDRRSNAATMLFFESLIFLVGIVNDYGGAGGSSGTRDWGYCPTDSSSGGSALGHGRCRTRSCCSSVDKKVDQSLGLEIRLNAIVLSARIKHTR